MLPFRLTEHTVALNGLLVNNRCLGNEMWLTKVSPYNTYEDNKKTDRIAGYKYTVILPAKHFRSLDVKIESTEPLVRIPANADYAPVEFTNLEVKLYYDFDNQVRLSAKATGVKLKGGQA